MLNIGKMEGLKALDLKPPNREVPHLRRVSKFNVLMPANQVHYRHVMTVVAVLDQ
jgi:hypothetical protein